MQPDNFYEKYFGNVTCIIYLVAWNEMSHFTKMTHYHKK